ncbi:MAG: CCA tRNA nucleotidyltransferase [Candidatus Devosia phytovorans]|uniref:CCA tRNA nucleotidyltransferase n=1 Tax=Candidatus Devosia phytovorans TaxID=3121372 RepID=A0AAJ5VW34_9HYPH|nr:CCA tRNA nucleotidyltransferase [Devosia sp.]WEK05176.1 MAG: CCA tRNA nucleotidyltransferase [Devosia sp.]
MSDLSQAEWLNKPETQAILAALDGHKRRTRAVGGVVRDTIMGRDHSGDIDMATELLPDEVIERARAAGIAVYPTGIEHGTVTLRLGDVLAEVTTLRQDVETDGRHAVVAFGTDWVEDARRRDFTLNALYCAADGTLYDPLGGVEDARNGRVRFIGAASQRIAEDGLRVYRFFRLSASHAAEKFDPDGLSACADAVNRLDHLSRERVGGEVMRMLGLPRVALTLAVMSEIGLLRLDDQVLRDLVAYEDIGGQSVAARLAMIAGPQLDQYQARWRLSNEVVGQAQTVGRAADLMADERIAEAAYRHGELAVEGLAIAAARGKWAPARLAEGARMLGSLVVPPFPVSGHDLAGLGMVPGPALGIELARLERAWIDSGFALGKAELLAEARI